MIDMKKLAPLLQQVKTIAVVGAVDKPGRPVNMVGRTLIDMGYDVIPVHPKREKVWGLRAYPNIKDIPVAVDMVDLFRAAQYCPDHAREILELTPLPKIFWMQSGIISQEAKDILAVSNIHVVEDRCIKVELQAMGITR